MAFNTLTVQCECYLYVVLKQFITRKEDWYPLAITPHLPTLCPAFLALGNFLSGYVSILSCLNHILLFTE